MQFRQTRYAIRLGLLQRLMKFLTCHNEEKTKPEINGNTQTLLLTRDPERDL